MPHRRTTPRPPRPWWWRWPVKAAITVAGTLLLLAGLVMLVAPGPGLLALAAGLGLLSTEYRWADRWLAAARHRLAAARTRAGSTWARRRTPVRPDTGEGTR